MKYNFIALRARSFVALLLVVACVASLLATLMTATIAEAQAPDGVEVSDVSESTQLTCNDVRGKNGLAVLVPHLEERPSTEPGAQFMVPVTISNSYQYELRDLTIGAVLFYNGNAVPFDWFTAESHITVGANSQKAVPLTWTVPHNAQSGSYELAVYIQQGETPHLLTSALGRDALSDSLDFTVTGEAQAGAQFDISSIKVNGKAMTAQAINTFAADTEQLEFSIDIVNQLKENPQVGPVTLTVYESFYPHSLSELESETFEARLLSDSRYTYNLDFGANFDQYIITGQFKAEDGSQSSFLVLLQRDGAAGTLTQPLPTVSFVGVAPKGDESEIVACIDNRESALLSEDELAPSYPVSYRLTVHPIDEAGEPVRSDLIATTEGSAELGGGIPDLGISKAFASTDEFMVRLDVLKDGEVVDVREVRYQCDPDFGCTLSPEMGGTGTDRTILGIGMGALMLGMKLATLAILITVLAIFFCNIYPLVMRRRTVNKDVGGNGPSQPNT